jgi:hypothetical protein
VARAWVQGGGKPIDSNKIGKGVAKEGKKKDNSFKDLGKTERRSF